MNSTNYISFIPFTGDNFTPESETQLFASLTGHHVNRGFVKEEWTSLSRKARRPF